MEIEEIVALSVKQNASDLHLCSMQRPRWRREGKLAEADALPVLSSVQLENFAVNWLNDQQRQQFELQGQVDLAITLADGIRLRANFFRQRTGLSLALRRIAGETPTLQQLYAPASLEVLTTCQHGLILVTGATGSGKSTTLAAMIAHLNQHSKHILTLEDPIEFVHCSQHSLIQQREIGTHCASFAAGLRAALREDPDVILLGELRDEETIRLALTAAETGHLVLATLHTRSAASAIERLTDVFSSAEKSQVRSQLAASLQAVIAQRLQTAAGGGRIALYEVLINTPAIASMIREGKNHQIAAQLQTGGQWGMQTFEQSLVQRKKAGLVATQGGLANQSSRIITAD